MWDCDFDRCNNISSDVVGDTGSVPESPLTGEIYYVNNDTIQKITFNAISKAGHASKQSLVPTHRRLHSSKECLLPSCTRPVLELLYV